jgi:hypothetical protein
VSAASRYWRRRQPRSYCLYGPNSVYVGRNRPTARCEVWILRPRAPACGAVQTKVRKASSTRPEADGAALIGRLSLRDDGKWLDFCNSSRPDRSRRTKG